VPLACLTSAVPHESVLFSLSFRESLIIFLPRLAFDCDPTSHCWVAGITYIVTILMAGLFFFFFWDSISLCRSGWPGTGNPSLSASPRYWDYRHGLLHLAEVGFLKYWKKAGIAEVLGAREKDSMRWIQRHRQEPHSAGLCWHVLH
jgi:hypothetical protein